jgi:hypothetical protein
LLSERGEGWGWRDQGDEPAVLPKERESSVAKIPALGRMLGGCLHARGSRLTRTGAVVASMKACTGSRAHSGWVTSPWWCTNIRVGARQSLPVYTTRASLLLLLRHRGGPRARGSPPSRVDSRKLGVQAAPALDASGWHGQKVRVCVLFVTKECKSRDDANAMRIDVCFWRASAPSQTSARGPLTAATRRSLRHVSGVGGSEVEASASR